jgi:hypothetical protein
VNPSTRPPDSGTVKDTFRAVSLTTSVITIPSFLVNVVRSLLEVNVPDVDQTNLSVSSAGIPEAV